MGLFGKKNENYISSKETKRISKENRRITGEIEKKRNRKNIPESEYITTMKNPDNVVEFDNVHTYFFTDIGTVKAVDGVSFEVPQGKTVGIVGESGCGKSTLAKMLVGSLPVSSGKMELSGVDYAALKGKERRAFRRKIQMVFQDPLSSFSPRMKIGTYLAEPRRNYDKVSKQQAFAEAEQLLEKVGLPRDFLVRYPHELSGGQLQRVAIARALVGNPALLLADEPTGALDQASGKEVLRLFHRLHEMGNTIVMITHDLSVAQNAGRIVEIVDGRLQSLS